MPSPSLNVDSTNLSKNLPFEVELGAGEAFLEAASFHINGEHLTFSVNARVAPTPPLRAKAAAEARRSIELRRLRHGRMLSGAALAALGVESI